MKILPSPMRPVRAELMIASTARSSDGVVADDLDLHLGEEVDDVFGAAIKLGMALLAAESLRLDHGDALQADLVQRFFHLIQFERLDDGLDLLHARSDPGWPGLPVMAARVVLDGTAARTGLHAACQAAIREARRVMPAQSRLRLGACHIALPADFGHSAAGADVRRVEAPAPQIHTAARIQPGASSCVKPANTLLSGIGTTIFTVMSALAVEHDVDQSRPGLPRHRRPGRRGAGRGRCAAGRPQPVSADARRAGTAPGRRRRQPPLLWPGGRLGDARWW